MVTPGELGDMWPGHMVHWGPALGWKPSLSSRRGHCEQWWQLPPRTGTGSQWAGSPWPGTGTPVGTCGAGSRSRVPTSCPDTHVDEIQTLLDLI